MKKIDCLLINPSTPVIPMGLFIIADLLKNNGFETKIISLPLEYALNRNFSLEKFVKNQDLIAIGISVHWFYQLINGLKVAREIKKILNNTYIVLGGFTASFFAEEILRKFHFIDFVIKGEGEIPFLKLVRKLSKKDLNLNNIPNLIWRKDKNIKKNSLIHCAKEKDEEKINFLDLKILKNYKSYLRSNFLDSLNEIKNLINFKIDEILFLSLGRGCSVNCLYCGGSKFSHKIINNRKNPLFFPIQKVMKTLEEGIKYGCKNFHICFDIYPNNEYYFKLFKEIKENKLDINLIFTSWSLPSMEFIDIFKETFKNGIIEISPECYSEELRKKIKGYFFRNEDLEKIIDYAKKRKIFLQIFFGNTFLNGDSRNLNETREYIEIINRKLEGYGKAILHKYSPDPGSLFYFNSKRDNVKFPFKSLRDYLDIRNYDKKELYLIYPK